MVTTKKGFTLIELIIVIAIIAVLGTAAFLVLTEWLGKSRDARRVSDISTINTAINAWDAGKEGSIDLTKLNVTGFFTWVSVATVDVSYQRPFDQKYFDALQMTELQKLVKDPKNKPYVIAVHKGGRYYNLMASKEFDTNGWTNPVAIVDGNFYNKVVDNATTAAAATVSWSIVSLWIASSYTSTEALTWETLDFAVVGDFTTSTKTDKLATNWGKVLPYTFK